MQVLSLIGLYHPSLTLLSRHSAGEQFRVTATKGARDPHKSRVVSKRPERIESLSDFK